MAGYGEHQLVDADRHDRHVVERHARLGGDVSLGVGGHGDDARDLRPHPLLHAQEVVPGAQRDPAAQARRVGEVELLIDGDGAVDGRGDGPSVAHHAEDPGAQTLVVVHEIEVVAE